MTSVAQAQAHRVLAEDAARETAEPFPGGEPPGAPAEPGAVLAVLDSAPLPNGDPPALMLWGEEGAQMGR